MPKTDLKKKTKLEQLSTIKLMKQGGSDHKIAKEHMLYLLVNEQEKVAKALIRKAKAGDVRAIVEFFDRLYGKAKETIDFGGNVQFSLKELARRREQLKLESEVIDVVVEEAEKNNG